MSHFTGSSPFSVKVKSFYVVLFYLEFIFYCHGLFTASHDIRPCLGNFLDSKSSHLTLFKDLQTMLSFCLKHLFILRIMLCYYVFILIRFWILLYIHPKHLLSALDDVFVWVVLDEVFFIKLFGWQQILIWKYYKEFSIFLRIIFKFIKVLIFFLSQFLS